NYVLKEGDILSIDCGVKLNGFHSDSAYTYAIGEISPELRRLLKVTHDSLYIGIEKAVVGGRMGDIGFAIQRYVEAAGFTIIRELVGHGLGRELHESPEVPNYGKRGKGVKLREGLVLAIEPMVNMGKRDIVQESDGWTIRTKDRKPSAHFEHTIVIFKDRTEVLTTHKYIKEEFKV
ncbi:MAG: type I methionyl aminopeptidase, partial [Cytophagales bacterium]|nr:type I methionyl aminopeptidase [Cytophagales bacterium]